MTNEDRKDLIEWCIAGCCMTPKKAEVVVDCIEWMENIVDSNINDLTGEPMYADSEKELEKARFILECIDYYMY